jgi:hypothetical protein
VRRHSLHDHRLCVGPSIGLHSSAAGALLTSLLVHFLQSSARSPRHVSRRRTTSAAAGAMPSDASRGKERILGRGRRWVTLAWTTSTSAQASRWSSYRALPALATRAYGGAHAHAGESDGGGARESGGERKGGEWEKRAQWLHLWRGRHVCPARQGEWALVLEGMGSPITGGLIACGVAGEDYGQGGLAPSIERDRGEICGGEGMVRLLWTPTVALYIVGINHREAPPTLAPDWPGRLQTPCAHPMYGNICFYLHARKFWNSYLFPDACAPI